MNSFPEEIVMNSTLISQFLWTPLTGVEQKYETKTKACDGGVYFFPCNSKRGNFLFFDKKGI